MIHNEPRVPPPQRVHATPVAQGPLDWLVPFIPPFLRMNRETRAALVASLQALSLAAIATQLAAFLQRHTRSLLLYGLLLATWIYGLTWTDRVAPEFTSAYVILTGLGALALHVYAGDAAHSPDGISAYSVFNKGGARMLGSLSAEQFENEIRHRQPDHIADHYDEHRRGEERAPLDASDSDDDDANDPDLLLAMQLSLQEQKREARRARRTTKRR